LLVVCEILSTSDVKSSVMSSRNTSPFMLEKTKLSKSVIIAKAMKLNTISIVSFAPFKTPILAISTSRHDMAWQKPQIHATQYNLNLY